MTKCEDLTLLPIKTASLCTYVLLSKKLDIMRKEYRTPVADLVQLEVEPIMTTTSAETGGANVGNKPVGGDTPDLAGESRGQWGNLW